jgi:N-succinyldiaminopimelate aminotransferase
MVPMASVLRGSMRQFGTSVFTAYTVLANERKAVNLSQGFPDFEPPQPLLDAAVAALGGGFSQYAPADGDLALREAVAEHQAARYGQSWDPGTEVTVTCGATEAIWTVLQALVEPGEEVVLFEPYYDQYPPAVVAVGGVPRVVPNSGFPDFRLDLDRLAATIGPATKLVILNTPWNPIGRRITAEELRVIGELCQRHGAYVLSDETYEHLVYDGAVHRPAVSEPLLADRTITVSSVSKTFSATGWRVGWAVAPAELSDAVRKVHQFVTFTAPAPLQRAAAVMLATAGTDFYAGLEAEFAQRRDLLLTGLRPLGLELGRPEATYFVLGRCEGDEKDYCVDLIDRVGVAAIPASALYGDPANGRGLVRFTFCKRLSTLTEAADRIAASAE